MFKKKAKQLMAKVVKPDFTHLNNADAARKLLVDNFPGSTINSWKWKGTEEEGEMAVRVFSGPMEISAAVVYNPHALEEKYAQILDTSGNYDITKYDPSKFQNAEMSKDEEIEKLMGHAMPKKLTKEEKKALKEQQKAAKKAQPKLTKKEKADLKKLTQDVITDHNLGVLNVQIFLKQGAEKHKDDIIEKLDSMGVMYVISEVTNEILHGSEEFAGVNAKKQEKTTTLVVECMADDGTMLRLQLADNIAAIYRKV